MQQVNNGNKFHGPCLKGVKNVKIKPPTPVLTRSGHVQRVNNCNKFHGPCLRGVKNITRPPLCNMSRVGDEPHSPRTSDQKRNAHSRKTRMFKRPPGPLWASILVPLCASILGQAALGDIDFHFVWQAWGSWHWAGSGGAIGSRLAPWSPGLFVWQAWHLPTSTSILCGRCGTC